MIDMATEQRRRSIPLDASQLPRAIDAEAGLVASALDDHQSRELLLALPAGAITVPSYVPLVALMRAAQADGVPCDRIALLERARGLGMDGDALFETMRDIEEAAEWSWSDASAKLLRDRYEQRVVIQRVHATLELMVTKPDDAPRTARALVESLLDFSAKDAPGFRHAAEALRDAYAVAKQRAAGDPAGSITTGVAQLDGDDVGGLEAGDLVTWLMVSGHGKTAAAELIGLRAALAGTGVGFFSAEMKDEQVARRWGALFTGIPFQKLKSWDLHAADQARAHYAEGVIQQLPLYVDDQGTPSLAHVVAQSRRLLARDPRVKILMVDYVTLIQSGGNTEVESVMRTARALKRLAKELKVVVIGLCQVDAKAVEKLDPDEQMPQANQASWSQELRNQSDIMICGYRPGEAWRQKTGQRKEDYVGRFSAQKTRNAAGGSWTWSWHGPTMAFDHGCWATFDAMLQGDAR